MSDFEINTRDLQQFSKMLKTAHPEMRRELTKGLKAGARPLVPIAKKAAADTFSKRGGLARRESRIPFRVQVATGRDPGVRIVAPGKYIVGKTVNATGKFRHPVFPKSNQTRRQWTWVEQHIPGGRGWFDTAMRRNAPMVKPEVQAAAQRVIDSIVRGASR